MKIVRAGTLIDGTGAPPVRDAVIQIDTGRIEAVTTAAPSRTWPAGAHVIDPANLTGLAAGVEGVRVTGRTVVRAGADVIKCATTGGASSRARHGPKDSEFTLEEMKALVDEAHSLGRRVMCHALGGAGLRVAIEAGVDSIEHGCYLDEDRELIPMMAERHVFYVPTLTVYEYHPESPPPHVPHRSHPPPPP